MQILALVSLSGSSVPAKVPPVLPRAPFLTSSANPLLTRSVGGFSLRQEGTNHIGGLSSIHICLLHTYYLPDILGSMGEEMVSKETWFLPSCSLDSSVSQWHLKQTSSLWSTSCFFVSLSMTVFWLPMRSDPVVHQRLRATCKYA